MTGAKAGSRPGPEPGAAPPVEPLAPDAAPLAILVDYDGTIALTDVSDTVMAEHDQRRPGRRWPPRYDAGQIGSRGLMEWEMSLIRADGADLLATAARQPHDPGFVPFVRRAQAAGIPVEVVSDGFGFFIAPGARAARLPELPVITARTTLRRAAARRSRSRTATRPASCAGPASASGCSPIRRPAGRSCSSVTARAIAMRPAMRTSSSPSAPLVPICIANGWPFQRWTEFAEIHAWLERGPRRLAARPGDVAHAAARSASRSSAAPRCGARAGATHPRDDGSMGALPFGRVRREVPVDCPSCGAANEVGRKFCEVCGTRLARACPNCSTLNGPTARFCGECGSALGPDGPSAGPSAATSRAGNGAVAVAPARAVGPGSPVAERRLVSVLFADLVGFTAPRRGPRSGGRPRAPDALLRPRARVVGRYGGTVEKFIGDAVMAVWGAPIAREDDAERAVRAALDLVDAVRTLGRRRRRARSRGARRRADRRGRGHHRRGRPGHGRRRPRQHRQPAPVALRRRAPCWSARRPSGPPRRAIAFEPAGEQVLKGKAAPVPAWRALRVVAKIGGVGRAEGLEPPFVGRDERAPPAQGLPPRDGARAPARASCR